MTSGPAATAAPTGPALGAPSATRGTVLPGLRFHAVVGRPERAKALAGAEPASPSPLTVASGRSPIPAPNALGTWGEENMERLQN
ncbi:hypothetical protein SUDANB121_00369 [Nocardiopsis dassonvillei]|uniref:hypothetical protein n=1 Tax=Nocardiopsis dassonvillei TaxID=2014 RepID=UPI003F5448A3